MSEVLKAEPAKFGCLMQHKLYSMIQCTVRSVNPDHFVFDIYDGQSRFLRNVGTLIPDCTASQSTDRYVYQLT